MTKSIPAPVRVTVWAMLALLLAVAFSAPALSQGVTTGNIAGTATDPDGDPLPGVVVTMVYEPDGTSYTAVTRANGEFEVVNVRVGGPYTIVMSLPGFNNANETGLTVSVGETAFISVTMEPETFSETL